ncbi:MAG: type II secretion system GspH family protein [Muribaculaceae bacterium]|nr:type II secretion system GspH family protein [Roseburia sp.]MCM1430498.1 type II secretion system GspH family protein [Muribaculaceae bacterium]MCM1493171.1 type II secretion system GspH family protein [Muribaculaceae bacterium]
MKKEVTETKKRNNKGFSLVELIVVIAIMAVLMVVLAPAMLRYVEKSRVQKDESAAAEVAHAVELALAQEDIYVEAGTVSGTSGSFTITLTGSTGAMTFPASATKLKADVEATVGTTVKMSSKTHSAQTYTITVTYNATRQAYEVVGAWPTATPTT